MNRTPTQEELEEAKAAAKLLARGLDTLTMNLLEIIKEHFVDFKYEHVTNGQLNKQMLEHIKNLPPDQFHAVAAFSIVQVLLIGPDKIMNEPVRVEDFINRMAKFVKENQCGNLGSN